MDKDRIVGAAKVAGGRAKVAVGKVLGDAKLQSEGQADKVEGTVQNAVGRHQGRGQGRAEGQVGCGFNL